MHKGEGRDGVLRGRRRPIFVCSSCGELGAICLSCQTGMAKHRHTWSSVGDRCGVCDGTIDAWPASVDGTRSRYVAKLEAPYFAEMSSGTVEIVNDFDFAVLQQCAERFRQKDELTKALQTLHMERTENKIDASTFDEEKANLHEKLRRLKQFVNNDWNMPGGVVLRGHMQPGTDVEGLYEIEDGKGAKALVHSKGWTPLKTSGGDDTMTRMPRDSAEHVHDRKFDIDVEAVPGEENVSVDFSSHAGEDKSAANSIDISSCREFTAEQWLTALIGVFPLVNASEVEAVFDAALQNVKDTRRGDPMPVLLLESAQLAEIIIRNIHGTDGIGCGVLEFIERVERRRAERGSCRGTQI